MSLVLDVDHTPAVLSASNRLSVNDDAALRAYDSEREHFLRDCRISRASRLRLPLRPLQRPHLEPGAHPDALIQLKLLVVVLLGIKRV